jgi:glucokinase
MDKPYVMGIDIGGTNTEFGVIDARGQIKYKGKVPTENQATGANYVANLAPALNKLISDAGGKELFVGIGVGAPNGNFYTGCMEFAPNISWARDGAVPLAKMISEATGLPCALTNDANAAAIGEMTYGAAKGMKNFIMITLGTGVGSGIVINGSLVYGSDGFAGELGHVIMRRNDGRLCGCGRQGCLEAYASATGVARTAREILTLNKSQESILRNIPIDKITSKDVFEAAVAGDKIAREIFEFTGNILGEAFADFIAFSSPEAIILFGGLAQAGDLIRKPIEESMKRNTLKVFKERGKDETKAKLLFSELQGAEAAIIGASALAWELK